jgi:hypothetical protein
MTSPCKAKNPDYCIYHGNPALKPITIPIEGLGERQAHGLRYEENIRQRFNLSAYGNYTGKFDAVYPDEQQTGISIKTKKDKHPLELADWFRNSEIQEDFYLIAGFWNNTATKKVEKEFFMKIPAEFWRQQFAKDIWGKRVQELLASVDNTRETDALWQINRSKLQDSYRKWAEEQTSIIQLNPKRDHKNQLRMQCSISYQNILKLTDRFPIEDCAKLRLLDEG